MGFFSAVEGDAQVTTALKRASRSTGTAFDYLFRTAMRESSMNPKAKARTSSAAGLFQFIESTWLQTVKESGAKHGLKKYADQITKTRDGRYVVSDPAARKKILSLRFDPRTAAVMAGALTERNGDILENRIGRDATEPELYMAHFMGARGAGRLIELTESSPDARADRFFPKEARANKPIFYKRGGRPRTIREVYAQLGSHHGADAAPPPVPAKRPAPAKADTRVASVQETAKPERIDQPIFDLLGFFKRRDDASEDAKQGETLFDDFYADAGEQRGAPRFLASFWNTDGPQIPDPVSAALRPTGSASGVAASEDASVPVPQPRPDSAASVTTKPVAPVEAVLSQWMESAAKGAVGRPLDLAEAARLYGRSSHR